MDYGSQLQACQEQYMRNSEKGRPGKIQLYIHVQMFDMPDYKLVKCAKHWDAVNHLSLYVGHFIGTIASSECGIKQTGQGIWSIVKW